jgi:uncharacterized paraquat-inducible protein A
VNAVCGILEFSDFRIPHSEFLPLPLLEHLRHYYINNFLNEHEVSKEMEQANAYIIRCPDCGASNRIPANRIGTVAKCGKCHAELPTDDASARPEDSYKMRCGQCGAKNRIPQSKLKAGAKCGKCGTQLKTEELFAPQPVMITDANFDEQVVKSPLPVLMWAWAPW